MVFAPRPKGAGRGAHHSFRSKKVRAKCIITAPVVEDVRTFLETNDEEFLRTLAKLELLFKKVEESLVAKQTAPTQPDDVGDKAA